MADNKTPCAHDFQSREIRDDFLGRPDPRPLVVWSCARCGEGGHPIWKDEK